MLIAGSSNKVLAENIARLLNMPITHCNISSFHDKEISVVIDADLAYQDVYIIQSTSSPANDTLMELLFIADAVRRSNVKSITAIIPYYGYGRQDRRMSDNGPISASCVAMLLESIGIKRIITVDLHSKHIESFFRVPVVNVCPLKSFVGIITQEKLVNCVIVSPDTGGINRTRKVSSYLNLPFIIINKKRNAIGECKAESIIGDVKGKNCYIIDDIVDTGGTLCQAVDILLANGAVGVYAYITHGVLSALAYKKIHNSYLKSLYISDSIYNAKSYSNNKIKVLSIAPLLAEQLQILHQ